MSSTATTSCCAAPSRRSESASFRLGFGAASAGPSRRRCQCVGAWPPVRRSGGRRSARTCPASRGTAHRRGWAVTRTRLESCGRAAARAPCIPRGPLRSDRKTTRTWRLTYDSDVETDILLGHGPGAQDPARLNLSARLGAGPSHPSRAGPGRWKHPSRPLCRRCSSRPKACGARRGRMTRKPLPRAQRRRALPPERQLPGTGAAIRVLRRSRSESASRAAPPPSELWRSYSESERLSVAYTAPPPAISPRIHSSLQLQAGRRPSPPAGPGPLHAPRGTIPARRGRRARLSMFWPAAAARPPEH